VVTPQANRHVLVIGGAGYIGSVLVRKLLASGYRVRVLDALLYKNESAIVQFVGSHGFSFQDGDFCRMPDLNQAMEGITDIILLAALVGDPVCRKFPDLARRINEYGTLQLIDRLNQFGIRRFIFMSTCSNYGLQRDDVPATEVSELNPQSLYAETKVRVEKRLLQSPTDFDSCVTVLRAATAYGFSPRMRFDLTVNEFTRELALGRELHVYDADTWRPYCHVEDICAAIQSVLEVRITQVHEQVFNVGDNAENHTKRMIVDLLCTMLPGARIRYQSGSVDPRNYRVSFGKITKELGFQTRYTVAQFVRELIEAVQSGRFHDVEESPQFHANLHPHLPHS
jgi:nucleoside-diphosphate-sugar epimerase